MPRSGAKRGKPSPHSRFSSSVTLDACTVGESSTLKTKIMVRYGECLKAMLYGIFFLLELDNRAEKLHPEVSDQKSPS